MGFPQTPLTTGPHPAHPRSTNSAHPRESGGPAAPITRPENFALDSRLRGNERGGVAASPHTPLTPAKAGAQRHQSPGLKILLLDSPHTPLPPRKRGPEAPISRPENLAAGFPTHSAHPRESGGPETPSLKNFLLDSRLRGNERGRASPHTPLTPAPHTPLTPAKAGVQCRATP